MSVSTRTVVEGNCDECSEAIDTTKPFVDAMVYGAAFHCSCWERIGGPRVARVLGLDDIRFYTGTERGERAWGPR